MIRSDLVFDIGMHRGEDTGFYLGQGYTVVGVDADPELTAQAGDVFRKEVEAGKLLLLNCAVSDREEQVEFNISEVSLFNSLHRKISDRKSYHKHTVTVPSRTLRTLFTEFGVPYYCKIDIEGYDAVALRSMQGAELLPPYISCETECLGENETATEEQALETLSELKNLGYRQFKLIDQSTLRSLTPDSDLYLPGIMTRIRYRLRSMLGQPSLRESLQRRYNYPFPPSASGPFGEQAHGSWMDYSTARQALLNNRRRYFSSPHAVSYGFWCDWHARR